jgi:Spy/CpxP family protein refolding chaperone
MINLRQIVTTLCLGTCLCAAGVYAADPAPPPPGGPGPGHHWHGPHDGGPLGEYGMLLHKLNLTPEQKSAVKTILEAEKSQFQALHASVAANKKSLATTAPTDTAAYSALVTTAQENAATRISLETAAWSKIYSTVLTSTQQQDIPNIVAAAEAARQQRMSAWRAQHPQT